MTDFQASANKPPRLYWGGFATSLFGILIAAVFMIVQTVVIGIIVAVETASNPLLDIETFINGLTTNGFVLSIGSFATTLICVPLIFLIIRIKQGLATKEYLAMSRVSINKLAPWFLAVAAFSISYDFFSHFLGRPFVPEFMTSAYTTARFQPLFWIAIIVMAPVAEEFFFRGFLFQGFQSTFLKPAGTVALTSFLWAIIHMQYDIYDITAVFFLGIILGIARSKSGSIWTAVYLHAFINLIATIETAMVVPR